MLKIFLKISNKNLEIFFPTTFLENFAAAREQVKSNLPNKVDTIFTANSYHIDDPFKIWSAEKSVSGTTLIIGQHGGNFGVGLINQSELHQKKIADRFVTWGWDSVSDKNLIKCLAYNFQCGINFKKNCDGNILHVLSTPGRYFYQHHSMPSVGYALNYFQDQLTFLEGLNSSVIEKVSIRLDLSASRHDWDVLKILEQARYISNVEGSKKSLETLLKKKRACVFVPTMQQFFFKLYP